MVDRVDSVDAAKTDDFHVKIVASGGKPVKAGDLLGHWDLKKWREVIMAKLSPDQAEELAAMLLPRKANVYSDRLHDTITGWCRVATGGDFIASPLPSGPKDSLEGLIRKGEPEVSPNEAQPAKLDLGPWRIVERALSRFRHTSTLRQMLLHVYKYGNAPSTFTLFSKAKQEQTRYEMATREDFEAAGIEVKTLDEDERFRLGFDQGSKDGEFFPFRIRGLGWTEAELIDAKWQQLLSAIDTEIRRESAQERRRSQLQKAGALGGAAKARNGK